MGGKYFDCDMITAMITARISEIQFMNLTSSILITFRSELTSHHSHLIRPPQPILNLLYVALNTLGMLFQWKFLRSTIKNYDEEHLSGPKGARL